MSFSRGVMFTLAFFVFVSGCYDQKLSNNQTGNVTTGRAFSDDQVTQSVEMYESAQIPAVRPSYNDMIGVFQFQQTVNPSPPPEYLGTNKFWFVKIDGDEAENVGTYDLKAVGDRPIIGDWDGDSRESLGAYREQWSTFRLDNSMPPTTHPDYTITHGVNGDVPLVGDFNGDKRADVAVYRPLVSRFFTKPDSNGQNYATFSFGASVAGDVGIIGDWDGDGFDNVGLFRRSPGGVITNAVVVLTDDKLYDPVTGQWLMTSPPYANSKNIRVDFIQKGSEANQFDVISGDWIRERKQDPKTDGLGFYNRFTGKFYLVDNPYAHPLANNWFEITESDAQVIDTSLLDTPIPHQEGAETKRIFYPFAITPSAIGNPGQECWPDSAYNKFEMDDNGAITSRESSNPPGDVVSLSVAPAPTSCTTGRYYSFRNNSGTPYYMITKYVLKYATNRDFVMVPPPPPNTQDGTICAPKNISHITFCMKNPIPASPLILDTAGDGITLKEPVANKFDIDGDGVKDNISWPTVAGSGSDNRFLVLPSEGREDSCPVGRVCSINQLFGDNTIGPDGEMAANGFEALKKWNNFVGDQLNGQPAKITAQDSIFGLLRVWNDKNSNGKYVNNTADPGEIKTLAELGITFIRLDYTTQTVDPDQYGNEFKQFSKFKLSGGEFRDIIDVWFSLH